MLNPDSSILRIIKDTPLLYEVKSTLSVGPTHVRVEVIKEATPYEDASHRLILDIQSLSATTLAAESIRCLLDSYEGAGLGFSGDSTIRPFTCESLAQTNHFRCTEILFHLVVPMAGCIEDVFAIFSRMGVRID